MGEVYRATDTNLGRQVAIKVLSDTFANDPEQLARFEREAKTLASLNHPNIAQIYGFETADSTRALVMELVEGATLADRIAQPVLHQVSSPVISRSSPTHLLQRRWYLPSVSGGAAGVCVVLLIRALSVSMPRKQRRRPTASA